MIASSDISFLPFSPPLGRLPARTLSRLRIASTRLRFAGSEIDFPSERNILIAAGFDLLAALAGATQTSLAETRGRSLLLQEKKAGGYVALCVS